MNLSRNSELSLFNLLQSLSPQTVYTASTTQAQQRLRMVSTCLAARALPLTLWAKFPVLSAWQQAIAPLMIPGGLRQLYWCHTESNTPAALTPFSFNLPNTATLTPLCLADNDVLATEQFFLFLSSEITWLLVIRPQNTSTDIVSFIETLDPEAIATVLATLRKSLIATDSLPESIVAPHSLPSQADLTLVNQLWNPPQNWAPSSPPPVFPKSEEESTIDATFLAVITRELGTPLTNIKTALRLLESLQHRKEPRQRYLDLLKQECDRQNFILVGLQELFEIETKPDINAKVRLEDCVPGVVSTYQPIAKEKGISLGYTIPENYPDIACSAGDLRAILQHILHNSLKFTPANGKVYVRVNQKNKGVEITISDTGCGIEMSDLPRLFDCFYRGKNVDANLQGAGLGLTIVKRLLQRWGGRIQVKSNRSRGTYVYCWLPTTA